MSRSLLHLLATEEEGRLIRFFQQRLRDREDAADAMQETALRALQVSQATLIENPRAYLFQIAKSVARLTIMRQSRDRSLSIPLEEGLAVPCDRPDQEHILAARQHLSIMAREIESLPKRCQEVFVLSRIHGLSNGDIAARLGISRNMVEKHIIKALLHCRAVRAKINL
ncbi:sigma-70 family RNA polymerase sigma factor [Rhizobium sp. Leaf262]|uniref:sigma-70 family RNA polymerase sigma factor n=1 Tax=Rhizobium sp. Leaf262 TaxID=1736312 RepID=UPI0007146DC3|nr:sigma-70 family RNA polymerase sigma factor [Rhizobium sp. Leaf262]KQO83837.1 RNA polymerase subunit sigma [Rhizobium sp. Leaf262]